MATILLIEDNEMNRDMLSRRLKRKGFRVEVAVNGREGLDLAHMLQPSLILMDVSLPIMDGLTATRLLKNDPATSSIPIIVLTANAMATDKEKAIEAGCDEFDTKPVEFNRLLEKISVLLSSNQGEV
jgi:two-component system, cell cycle response regulator DivK